MLSPDQKAKLQLGNPWMFKGEVAERLQHEVVKLNADRARLWVKESGASMSLQAAAAGAGLIEATPALRSEFDRFNPQSQEERNRQRVAELMASHPFGKPDSYGPDGKVIPGVAPNLTAALELESLDPKAAQKLRAEAAPPAPKHGFTDREAALLSMHGYQLPS